MLSTVTYLNQLVDTINNHILQILNMTHLRRAITLRHTITTRKFSTSEERYKNYQCKLLVVGGGSGGCTIAARFARKLGKDSVIVLEPNDMHYYQPLFTLVGAGIKDLPESRRHMKDVLPKQAIWLKDAAEEFSPTKAMVKTVKGDDINYEYMLVAVGMKFDYQKVPGLKEALDMPDTAVSTIYSPDYCSKSFKNLQSSRSGDAIFTFPASPVKCPGAPQKICYLTDSYFRKVGTRSKYNITYNTALPVIFGVKKYADALWKVAENRKVNVNLKTVLTEVKPETKEAVFKNLDKPDDLQTMKYDLLHAVPPMSPPVALQSNKELTDANGFLEVDKHTLQHTRFPNIYGIGDCTNTPNSKTVAAVAAQSSIVERNLEQNMRGDAPSQKYLGYASCPLVTSHNTCILAEFNYELQPTETFPVNQAVERHSMYYLKKDLMPPLYWRLMLPGYWNGPGFMRKILNPFA